MKITAIPIAALAISLLSACSHRAVEPVQSAAEKKPQHTVTAPRPVVTDSTSEQSQGFDNLWQRMIAGFQLHADAPNHDASRIAAQRQHYINQGSFFTHFSERAVPYLHYIVEQADARNMPLELALLPMVESGFDPFAFSHGHAAGP